MNFKTVALATAFVAFAVAPSLAGTVTVDALPYYGNYPNPPGNGASGDYVALWYNTLATYPTPPAGYSFQTVSDWNGGVHNSGNGGSNVNLVYHDRATFTVDAGSTGVWSFQLGIDFGYGGTAIISGGNLPAGGVVLQTQAHDMWWSYSYSNPSQYLAGSIALTTPGVYTLNVYGAEICCDGGTQGQFLAPGAAGFQDFTTTSGVPEISTWAMMLAGFGGLGFVASRRRAAATA